MPAMCVPRDLDPNRNSLDGYAFHTWCGRAITHPGAFGPRGEPVYKSIDAAVSRFLAGDAVCPACCAKLAELFALPAKQAEERAALVRQQNG